MKKIIIALIVIIALVVIWKAIQTKPDASVPQATVSDTPTQQTGRESTPSATTTTTASTSLNTTEPAVSSGKQVDNSKVAIGFTGFGPGKKHIGSFNDVKSNLKTDTIKGLSGDITVNIASLTTDSDLLITHLKSPDFFDVAKYPTAKFVIKNIISGSVNGAMTIHGVTKNITFPIVSTPENYSATFTINMKEFGIDQKLANEVVELNVVVPLK